MIELEEEYNRYKWNIERNANKPGYESKWRPVIDQNFHIKNDQCVKEISLFLETYQLVQENIPRFDPMIRPGTKSYPEDFITLQDAVDLIVKDIDNFIINDSVTKLNIVNEYFNAVTGKRGLLLENDIRVEDGKFLNPKNQEKIDIGIMKIINKRIEYVLSSSKRKYLDREPKIKRILK